MIKLAILDMYNGEPNQGMRCINEIVGRYDRIVSQTYDVRGKNEIADLSYDIYISTGGPGSPLEGNGIWDKQYFDLLTALWEHNKIEGNRKKYVFFICHSFQMACHHFEIGEISNRKSRSFGTTPVHKTQNGQSEPFFEGLPQPFYVVDIRDWQVLNPNEKKIQKMGAKILALEKIRPHIPLERAIMAVRFSEEIFGVQFHPEADADGMLDHFEKETLKDKVIDEHGLAKYQDMISHLNDPDKIALTNEVIIPAFLNQAIEKLN